MLWIFGVKGTLVFLGLPGLGLRGNLLPGITLSMPVYISFLVLLATLSVLFFFSCEVVGLWQVPC